MQQMYQGTLNAVRLNGEMSEFFTSENGLKQGHNLSPTLFCTYINSLLQKLNETGLGIEVSESRKLCVLAYADDIVIIGKTADELQTLLNCLGDWCSNWRVMINTSKTNVMHVRK